jgi:antitoxin HigA-1
MIESFKHKGLRQLFEDDNPKGVNPEHVRKIKQILATMHGAQTIEGLDYATFQRRPQRLLVDHRTRELADYFSVRERQGFGRLSCGLSLKEASTMDMKNPPHPGEMIGDSLGELGVTLSDAAKGLGITRQQLHNVIAGRSAVTPEMAVRLEKALGSTADTWLRMQMNYDLDRIRKQAINVKRLAPA